MRNNETTLTKQEGTHYVKNSTEKKQRENSQTAERKSLLK